MSKTIDYTTSRVNSNVNYGLCVTTTCRYRFINCNKCATVVGDVDNMGGGACVGTGCMWEVSVPSPQVCCEPKITLKNSLNKKFINLIMICTNN